MIAKPYYIVRNSKIHGRGVFASRPIRKGVKILEYTGPIVTEKEADKIGTESSNGHSHTMLFQIGKNRVINGNEGGDARYINHSCDPNCETVQHGDQIFIEALRAIKQGEELGYDYHLQVSGRITEKERKEFACFCGSPKCRGTQIDEALVKAQDEKDAKKLKKKEEKRKKQLAKNKKAKEKEAQKKKKAEAKASKKEKKKKFDKVADQLSVAVVDSKKKKSKGRKNKGKIDKKKK